MKTAIIVKMTFHVGILQNGRQAPPTEFSRIDWLQLILQANIAEWSAGASLGSRVASGSSWFLVAPILWPCKQTRVIMTNSGFRRHTRIHLTRFRHLNEFLSPDFGYCTYSYILIQYVSKIYVRLIRSTYVLYNNKYLRTYFVTILPHRNCTTSYKSDEIVRFSALVGILEIYKKFNKSVKKIYLDKLWKCNPIQTTKGNPIML